MSTEIPSDIAAIFRLGKFYAPDYLAVAATFMRRIGLAATINRLVPSQMGVKPGTVVEAMVLDTLSGRTPLYRLSESMKDMDLELYLGVPIQSEELNDSCLGRAMDLLYEAGTSQVLTAVSQQAIQEFQIEVNVGNYDTTSSSVWGDYRMCEDESPGKSSEKDVPKRLNITYGHSKDHRPDMKQFLIETLCVGNGIPLLGKTRDGNASDKVLNNELLSNLSTVIPQFGINLEDFVYVADSAAVTEDNLKKASACGFISRLPFTYNECHEAVCSAVAAGNWQELGILAENQETSARKSTVYKAAESTVILYGKEWRAVVIHSSAHDKRRTNKLEKQLKDSVDKLEKQIKKQQMTFHCREDADTARQAIQKLQTQLHYAECVVTETIKRGRGRPAADGTGATRTCYELNIKVVEKSAAVEALRAEAGCFVLITNLKENEGKNAMNAKKLLTTYKQQCAVEMNFAFLKDPLIVNDLFLKTPRRIEALGLILLLALLIWRLMERSMRQYVQKNKTTLPGWDGKETDKPTSFMMSTKITGIQVFKLPDGTRHLLNPLTTTQIEYLRALGLTSEAFTNPCSICGSKNTG